MCRSVSCCTIYMNKPSRNIRYQSQPLSCIMPLPMYMLMYQLTIQAAGFTITSTITNVSLLEIDILNQILELTWFGTVLQYIASDPIGLLQATAGPLGWSHDR